MVDTRRHLASTQRSSGRSLERLQVILDRLHFILQILQPREHHSVVAIVRSARASHRTARPLLTRFQLIHSIRHVLFFLMNLLQIALDRLQLRGHGQHLIGKRHVRRGSLNTNVASQRFDLLHHLIQLTDIHSRHRLRLTDVTRESRRHGSGVVGVQRLGVVGHLHSSQLALEHLHLALQHLDLLHHGLLLRRRRNNPIWRWGRGRKQFQRVDGNRGCIWETRSHRINAMNQSENITAAETQFSNTRVVGKNGFSESKRVVTRIAISHLTLFLL